ncbi:hypothetical protein [Actinomadura sp. KC345]|uniref:hypothetical protein n=1 Tax=Actinomadura sp. KC345 TaxID=2530371 RepID=UPI001FB7C4A5|nr:hypothetical protein [Actinomadura sp. KC345]
MTLTRRGLLGGLGAAAVLGTTAAGRPRKGRKLKITKLADGLMFPEGPTVLPNGDVLVVELHRGTLTRVRPDGTTSVAAETGGGPNGSALGRTAASTSPTPAA